MDGQDETKPGSVGPVGPVEKTWDPTEAVARLAEETSAIDNGDSDATAERLLKQSAPVVALRLVTLATEASSETVSLNASKYVLDRVLGPVSKDTDAVDDPMAAFIERVEKAANASNV